ncbi:serine/threonine protein kinase and signal transduction histidine kinase with GAF sensor [Gracilibacillus ureilyticus]|uniref:histidine kinase n=1 Tax=Gracilibacillus ureilyticus TaxID=531814 RepID=A0A1H9V2U9_9BACI|nr:AAA family ATPase [Gracilibacillus ureilyticus]SES16002.1 serine/threonine protein kinase and signal transduction histidine kinase with GAF sensor [Gracilibacillus ureilyticus]
MNKLFNYNLTDKMVISDTYVLYKAVSLHQNHKVLIKTLNSQANPQSKAELVHEYYTLIEKEPYGVLQPVALEKDKEQPYVIMEFFKGERLTDWLQKNHSFDVNSFLEMAIKLTTILFSVHQKNIIHKSIHPNHVIYDDSTGQIRLTGFHQSTMLANEMLKVDITPYHLEEIHYISPEQTGRMNRPIDYRTDLYSLGVLLYEVATGQVPFVERKDAAELIHAHLAQTPRPPHEINPTIPHIISNIIMKLLVKMPEKRYQSTEGLKRDLEKCFHDFHSPRGMQQFSLGEFDAHPTLERPHKLYGREKEQKQLLQSFEKVKDGKPLLLLIPGTSGSGKTALVQKLQKPLLHKRGYYISGKFVQFQKHIPYAPLMEAFRSLIRQIQAEDSQSIEIWKQKLKRSLANNAWIIANFLPEIEWLIGKQEDGPDLPPSGIHNRFRLAVRNFIDVFAAEDHPLVLFIDDLQWADSATIDLMKHLLVNPGKRNLLVIGAYRDNEVEVGHPFEILLKQLKQEDVIIDRIPVHPLSKADINQWISEVLGLEAETLEPLVELIFRITKGNPFFINQLLQLLYQEQIIRFDWGRAIWEINLQELPQIPVTDTMLAFIMKQINKLPERTIRLLQIAACIGSQFNLTMLKTITGENYEIIAKQLWEGLEEGLILPMDTSYKWVYPNENELLLQNYPPSYCFLHDKIQQAFYSSMSMEERELTHLKIAEELFQHYTDEEIEENIFALVNHLNICQSSLSEKQLNELIKWNCIAGGKAKGAAAFQTALTYYEMAFKLLPERKWQTNYEEAFEIMVGYGETLYLNQRFEEAESTLEEALQHARTDQEKLYIYNLKITLYVHIHEVQKATESGLAGVRLFGLDIKRNPGKLTVGKEYLLTKLALGRKQSADLLKIEPVTDRDQHQVLRTLINTNAPTYHFNQNLATILMLRALRQTLKVGDMDVSALVYNNYALTLSAGFGDYEGSFEFGKLAMEHVKRSGDRALQARVLFVFGSFVNHWKEHLSYNLDYLEQSQQLSIETGNLHLAGATGAFIVLAQYLKGDHLEQVQEGIDRQLMFARKNEYAITSDYLAELSEWISVLTAPDKQPAWDFPDFTDDKSAAIIHKTTRLQLAYLLNNRNVAQVLIKELEPLVDNTLVLIVAPEYFFYHSLWLIKLMDERIITRKSQYKKLKKNLAKLKKWAKHSPANYRHKYLIVQAELVKLNKKHQRAEFLYHQAIELAQENGFLQDTAVANYCAAQFYLAKGLPQIAKSYMTEAYNGYVNWGAVNIANQIKASHQDLLLTTKDSFTVGLTSVNQLDTKAIFEAARIISSEVVLADLIDRLMEIVLTYAGAEHASFLLNKGGKIELVSYHYYNGETVQSGNAGDIQRFSRPIVHYVVNSREVVVLDNAAVQGNFTEDRYIQEACAKSVLCLPIIYQDKLVAVLYMENNQSTHIFTQERLSILTLITSQAAVSIENAYLYADLEEKVRKRTKLLNETNQALTDVNQELTNSKEKMKHLLSNISHDLQSPIAVVQGYLTAMLDGVVSDSDKQIEFLRIIQNRVSGLDQLMKDLFDLSKLETGNMNFSMEAIPVDQLYRHFCKVFSLEVEQAGLKFSHQLKIDSENEFPLIEVDVMRMEQVMANLVSNAVKHTESGTIELVLSISDTEDAVFSIKDEGDGIARADIPYVFDRYYTKRAAGGNGLGLAISKEIIACHNGEIWVESTEGEGSIFAFSIPIADETVYDQVEEENARIEV